MSIFNSSTLMISARSPFARRVRVAFLEHKINYEEVVLNVFENNPILNRHNPLRRVPTLVMASGDEIVDSNSILKVFYDEWRQSPFSPVTKQQKTVCENWSGIAVGLCELIVQYFLESQRASGAQDKLWMKEMTDIVEQTLIKYERFLGQKEFCLGQQITQTDIDWGVAIAYLQLRIPASFSELMYPKLFEYMKRLNQRESFKKTQPPA